MRQRKTFMLLGVISAILIMSVAYATISNIQLDVKSQVTVTPNQANFRVVFTGEPTHTGNGTAELEITGDTTATMNVSGLTVKGEKLTAKFNVINTSVDLTAYLSSNVTHNNTEYFAVTATLDDTELAPVNGTTTLNVTVELIKTPITANQTDTITVQLVASPYEQKEVSLINFTIENNYDNGIINCYAEEGMKWREYLESSYNTETILQNYYMDDSSNIVWIYINNVRYSIFDNDGYYVDKDEKIINGSTYSIDLGGILPDD